MSGIDLPSGFFEHRLMLLGLIRSVGVEGEVQWLPNGYWPSASIYDNIRTPWLCVSTANGPIIIGWRKRVIQITWGEERRVHGREVVVEDWITHGAGLCHAYSWAQAVVVLRALIEKTAARDARARDEDRPDR